jgi:hypothetical protein
MRQRGSALRIRSRFLLDIDQGRQQNSLSTSVLMKLSAMKSSRHINLSAHWYIL